MTGISVFLLLLAFAPGSGLEASGLVEDGTGRALEEATVEIFSLHGMRLGRAATDEQGRFRITGLRPGTYLIDVNKTGFERKRGSLRVEADSPARVHRFVLSIQTLHTEISVTASPGSADELLETPHMVAVTDGPAIRRQGHPTLGSVLHASPGVLVQGSTVGQVSPFLRGMTGYHVLNLVDGVRFSNSTFRFGPNQYLAFLEPASADRLEATLGPAASEYGSDALGGTLHVLTPPAPFSPSARWQTRGRQEGFFGSADLSAGTSAQVSFGNDRVAGIAGGTWRHHNDLRGGGGTDSHHVLRRLLGLSGQQIRGLLGSRLRETAFSQTGAHARLGVRVNPDQQLTLWYQHSAQRGVRGYKDLWGGLGRLRAGFAPQALNFFYLRHEKQSLGPLDSLVATFSINSQRDGFVSQGVNSSDPQRTDRSRADVYGYSVQGRAHRGSRHTMVFGGELYDERVNALRLAFPGGVTYRTLAFHGQSSLENRSRRIKATAGGRMTSVWFRGRVFRDATYNTSLTLRLTESLRFHLLAGRGFRAPNLNDLGTVGLQDLGFEIPAEAAATAAGLVGSNSGEAALTSGSAVKPLGSERLFNYEVGLAWRGSTTYLRAQAFDAELYDAIARRTVLFQADSPPNEIAGVAVFPIPSTPGQALQGVTAVATRFDPRAVKAFVNVGRQRYAGFELLLEQQLPASLSLSANYSFVAGRELDPGGPVRRLPPQQGAIRFRYVPSGRFWTEIAVEAAGEQRRLSGGDLSDERIGAERSRDEIAAFFHGERLRPYIRDGVFLPTGETLEEIQLRVVPLAAASTGSTRVPLFVKNPGYAVVHWSAGFLVSERASLHASARNLADRNHRRHGSGVDAPGFHLIIGWQIRF